MNSLTVCNMHNFLKEQIALQPLSPRYSTIKFRPLHQPEKFSVSTLYPGPLVSTLSSGKIIPSFWTHIKVWTLNRWGKMKMYFYWYYLYCTRHCPLLGPLTPTPIYLNCSKNNVLDIWMTKLMSDSNYLVPIWSWSGPKLDHFWILNFPSLFSDWSIQKFWKNIL